jgi:acetate kinase
MRILALNSGSSSIKCALIESANESALLELRVEQIGAGGRLLATGVDRLLVNDTYDGAMDALLEEITRLAGDKTLEAVAHRVVHGGEAFTAPTVVTDVVLKTIESLSNLAPLHNPPAVAVLRAARKRFASVPHVAVFDTAFHSTLPSRAREYAISRELAKKHGLRRFGFHGISYRYLLRAVAQTLNTDASQLRIVACHLGNGASMCAIEHGHSVETSMGMTPLEGLVMGTRAGDIDAGVLLRLMEEGGMQTDELDRVLNREAGLQGLTGTFDFREIERRASEGDEGCRLAVGLYAHRIRKYVGAYAAVMGGMDALVFTGGIGENSATVRHRVCQRLDFLGAVLDEDRNRDARANATTPVIDLSSDVSRARILVVRADEQAELAREAAQLLANVQPPGKGKRIPVAVSARHAHLTVPTIEALFGPGYQLTKRMDLSQHGQYAANETIALIGPRGRIDKVRVMGPPRKEDQIEISRTDEFVLGIDAPIRLSGDLANTPGVTLEGPHGQLTISRGVICAQRHIHMNPSDAKRLGVTDRDSVDVRIDSEGRDLTFSDVIVRVSPDFELEMHVDTDEGNAAEVVRHQEGEVFAPMKADAAIQAVKSKG